MNNIIFFVIGTVCLLFAAAWGYLELLYRKGMKKAAPASAKAEETEQSEPQDDLTKPTADDGDEASKPSADDEGEPSKPFADDEGEPSKLTADDRGEPSKPTAGDEDNSSEPAAKEDEPKPLPKKKSLGVAIKTYFTPKFDRLYAVLCAAVFLLSECVYAFEVFGGRNDSISAFINAVLLIWLFEIGRTDLKEKIIPNRSILAGLILWVLISAVRVISGQSALVPLLAYSAIGAGVYGGILVLIALIARNALGMGDVKMFFVIGLFYGLMDTYSILLLTVLLMAVVSVVLLIAKKVNRKTAVPMAPFAFLSLLINIFLGI